MLLEKIGSFMSFDRESLIPITDITIDSRSATEVRFYFQLGGAQDQRRLLFKSFLYTEIQKNDLSFCTDKADFLLYISETFNLGGGGDIPPDLENRLQLLENKIVKGLWYEPITINDKSDGTSGTILPPTNTTILPFSLGGASAIVVKTRDSYPIEEEIQDTDPNTSEEWIAVDLDPITGNYTILGQLAIGDTPIPAAILYQYTVPFKFYDATFDLNEIPVIENSRLIFQDGNIVIDANVIVNGSLNFGGQSVTVLIAGNTNDLIVPDLDSKVLIRLQSTGNFNITGIIAPNPVLPAMKFVYNVGVNNISFSNNAGASQPQNRLLSGANFVTQPNEGFIMIYDDVDLKWRVVALNI